MQKFKVIRSKEDVTQFINTLMTDIEYSFYVSNTVAWDKDSILTFADTKDLLKISISFYEGTEFYGERYEIGIYTVNAEDIIYDTHSFVGETVWLRGNNEVRFHEAEAFIWKNRKFFNTAIKNNWFM